ncbi:lysophospholipid acyltransferase family protein [Polaribacter aestuariivivens]|uniref:Lysophospholipid acyltransferase family protein n=1 Tax=Polaribacter aestuariivivens TaxID=2304626 RepID=A0A5S3N1S7_9FLAO|nr:lysophospholipid acyltransferase family protein [Polaribacter aestuariivivens]TMM28722.1 lysophospholipid acyltransferase family protein [Polaribacter aestuariivivens]
MQFIVFAITYPIIWVLSKLPMRILYIKSDFFFFLIYYVIGYRKSVVLENLQLAFPEKPEQELLKIRKKFFKHLMDLMMESVKAFSISEKEILKRYRYKNPELVNKFTKQGRDIALVGAHQANWEWSTSLAKVIDIDVYGAYTKLNNKYFEKYVRSSREKFGVRGYKTSEMVKGMQKRFSEDKRGAYILLSDQSPQPHKTYYWREFFNIKVPVHTGAEMLSKRFDLVVINYVAKKVKRGYYEIEFQLITETPKDFEDYKITDLYTELTEKNILAQPEYYLWSHKRFKHRDKVPAEFK